MNTIAALLVIIQVLVHGKPNGFSDARMLSRREAGSCGPLQFPAASGLMTTPNFPGNYGDLMDCVYTIEPPGLSNFTVDLYLCECRLEYDFECGYDWLQLGKGTHPMCGNIPGRSQTVDSTDSKVEVTFHSDTNTNDLGCSIAYKIEGSDGYIGELCPSILVLPIKNPDSITLSPPKGTVERTTTTAVPAGEALIDQYPYDLLIRCGLIPPNP